MMLRENYIHQEKRLFIFQIIDLSANHSKYNEFNSTILQK